MSRKITLTTLMLFVFSCLMSWGNQAFGEPTTAPQTKGFWESVGESVSEMGSSMLEGLEEMYVDAYEMTLTDEEQKDPAIQAALKKKRKKLQKKEEIRAESSLVDNLIETNLKKEQKNSRIPKLYDSPKLSYYSLDLVLSDASWFSLDEQASNTGHYYFHMFNNGIWTMNLVFSRIVVWVLENALELDIVDDAGESISDALKTLAGFEGLNLSERGIYGLLFPLMIVFLGMWVGWQALVKDDSDGASRGLIHSFVIIFFSFFFFYFSQAIITEANNASSEITKGVMAISTNIMQPTKKTLTADEATVVASNNLWGILVYQPYLLLQYGSTHVDKERVSSLLKNNPQSSKRAEVAIQEVTKGQKGYKNVNMLPQNNSIRLGFIIMISLLNLAVGAIVVLLAAGLPLFQLYFMFVVLLAPIALVWAIVPAWKDSAYSWASELLGALLMKLALGVMLSIYFALSGALYSFADDKGYVMTMFLQFILIALIISKRQMIFDLVISPTKHLTGHMPGSTRVLDDVIKRGKKTIGTGAKIAGKAADFAMNQRRGGSLKGGSSVKKSFDSSSYSDPDEESKENGPKYSLNQDNDVDVSGPDDDDSPPPSGELTLLNTQITSTKESDDPKDDNQDPPPSPPSIGELVDQQVKEGSDNEEEPGDFKGNPPPEQMIKELPSLKPTVGQDEENGNDDESPPDPSGPKIPILIQNNAKYNLFNNSDDQEGKDET